MAKVGGQSALGESKTSGLQTDTRSPISSLAGPLPSWVLTIWVGSTGVRRRNRAKALELGQTRAIKGFSALKMGIETVCWPSVASLGHQLLPNPSSLLPIMLPNLRAYSSQRRGPPLLQNTAKAKEGHVPLDIMWFSPLRIAQTHP